MLSCSKLIISILVSANSTALDSLTFFFYYFNKAIAKKKLKNMPHLKVSVEISCLRCLFQPFASMGKKNKQKNWVNGGNGTGLD